MSKLLSIIIPVYNVEKYIEKCINSVINQDLTPEQYEIIVVNDGTPDNAANIAKSIAKAHTNITVIDQDNAGIGMTRNKGVDNAQGKYVIFLDSDDYLDSNSIAELVREAEKNNLDILAFNFRTIKERENAPRFSGADATPYIVCTGQEYMTMFKFLGMVCPFMYRREFLNDNNLRFKSLRYEDEELLPRIMIECNRIMYIDKVIYNYVLHNNSFMNSKITPQAVNDSLTVMKNLNNFINSGRVTDSKIIEFLKKRVNKLFYITFKRSVKGGINCEELMINESKKFNIIHKGIYIKPFLLYWIMINFPKLFIGYYHLNYKLRGKLK